MVVLEGRRLVVALSKWVLVVVAGDVKTDGGGGAETMVVAVVPSKRLVVDGGKPWQSRLAVTG